MKGKYNEQRTYWTSEFEQFGKNALTPLNANHLLTLATMIQN